MATQAKGVGRFTSENIVEILYAVEESNGSYRSIAKIARARGVGVSDHTISSWVAKGKADQRAQRSQTAYARFALLLEQKRRDSCSGDNNRNRELDEAIRIMQRTCDCGSSLMLLPSGRMGDCCEKCYSIELSTGRKRLNPQAMA